MIEAHNAVWWAGIILLGSAVGTVAGAFGVGGNFLLIPLLTTFFGVPVQVAVGTGLFQVIGSASTALFRHRSQGNGELKLDILMVGGGLAGAQLGVRTMTALAAFGDVYVAGFTISLVRLVVSSIFILILMIVGISMFLDVRSRPSSNPLPAGFLTRIHLPPYTYLPVSGRNVSVLAVAYLGLLLGFLSGLVGMGGGILLMPMLLYGIGMRVRVAAASGLVMLVSSAISGSITHYLAGHLHLMLALTLMTSSMAGAVAGSYLGGSVSGRGLRAGFVGIVAFTLAAVVWDLRRAFGMP